MSRRPLHLLVALLLLAALVNAFVSLVPQPKLRSRIQLSLSFSSTAGSRIGKASSRSLSRWVSKALSGKTDLNTLTLSAALLAGSASKQAEMKASSAAVASKQAERKASRSAVASKQAKKKASLDLPNQSRNIEDLLTSGAAAPIALEPPAMEKENEESDSMFGRHIHIPILSSENSRMLVDVLPASTPPEATVMLALTLPVVVSLLKGGEECIGLSAPGEGGGAAAESPPDVTELSHAAAAAAHDDLRLQDSSSGRTCEEEWGLHAAAEATVGVADFQSYSNQVEDRVRTQQGVELPGQDEVESAAAFAASSSAASSASSVGEVSEELSQLRAQLDGEVTQLRQELETSSVRIESLTRQLGDLKKEKEELTFTIGRLSGHDREKLKAQLLQLCLGDPQEEKDEDEGLDQEAGPGDKYSWGRAYA